MIKIVIGAGFGDEGKGLTTSYLCSQVEKPLVIRFSGGQQAGHTVVHNDHRHVFANFGSGTLQGVPTYWSEYCTFDPLGVFNEHKALKKAGVSPVLYVNPLCPVTTPYDKCFNRSSENKNQHGSCGVGVGATIQRQEDFYKLYVQDLFHEKVLRHKLQNIKAYYAKKSGILPAFVDSQMNIKLDDFLYLVNEVKKIITVADSNILSHFDNLIFEGSQGILLDQDFGFFPNVTRSNTTTKNAIKIIQDNAGKILKPHHRTQGLDIEVYYITRAYQTRHGNGFMTNEGLHLDLKNAENETNVTNEWQGDFRRSVLDLDLLNYALKCDANFSSHLRRNMVITCIDQTGEQIQVTENNELLTVSPEQLADKLPKYISKVYFSRGDTKETITQDMVFEGS